MAQPNFTPLAEGILKACRFSLLTRNLNFARKFLLATTGLAAVGTPIVIGLLHAPAIQGQSQAPTAASPPLEFEVASIKPSKSVSRGFSVQHVPSGLTATNASLQNLIEMAYQVKGLQIAGAPNWLNSERFDIVAKAPPNSTRAQILPMLGPLLVERFKLATHRETKELPGYALIVAKNGSKLQESKAEESRFNGDRRGLTAQRMSITQLADTLARRLDRGVVDMTGIQGFFDLKLEWTPDESSPMQKPGEGGEGLSTAPTDGPTIFTALQEQLGLKLESRKVPVEILVIDHVEKLPSEN